VRCVAPAQAPGCLITCGLSRSAACWEWRETRVEVAKEKKHWYSKKKGPDVEVERRWAQTGRLGGARDWVTALAADDAGAFVVGGCRGGDLLAWRPPKEATAGVAAWSEVAHVRDAHATAGRADRAEVNCVAYDGARATLASGGSDWYVKLWDAATLGPIATLGSLDLDDGSAMRGHGSSVRAVAVGDRVVLSGGDDRRVLLWDPRASDAPVASATTASPVRDGAPRRPDGARRRRGRVRRCVRPSLNLRRRDAPGAGDCAHAGWVSLLREDGLLATFDATTWKRVADADAGAALPSIKPACLAVTRLPRSRF